MQEQDMSVLNGSGDGDFMRGQYLTFRIENGEYGVGISYVIDIIRIQEITAVPHMYDYVKGITNLRGTIIPVIDMRLRFGLSETEYTDRTCIIVLNMEDNSIGIIVDEVQEVLKNIDEDALQSPPKIGGEMSVRNQFVRAVGMSDGRVKQFLDMNKVFETDGSALAAG